VFAKNRSPDFYREIQKQIVQKDNGTKMAIPETYPVKCVVASEGKLRKRK
jgi:hypothetical protein